MIDSKGEHVWPMAAVLYTMRLKILMQTPEKEGKPNVLQTQQGSGCF